MSEMVERVAEALWRENKRQDDERARDYGTVNTRTDRDYKVAITDYMNSARAAIAAMREPTSDMTFAGTLADSSEGPTEIWQAMIDKALE